MTKGIMERTKKNGNRWFWRGIWAAAGILLSIVAAFLFVSEEPGIDRIYDAGQVCDIFEDIYHTPGEGMEYLPEKNVFLVTQENACQHFDLYQMQEEWSYIFLELSGVNADKIPCQMVFYDNTAAETGRQETYLQAGENWIQVAENVEYSGISFVFPQAGTEYYIDDLQFRTVRPSFTKQDFLKYFAVTMILYLLLCMAVGRLYRKTRGRFGNWYVPVEGMQQVYCVIGEQCSGFGKRFSDRTKGKLRVLLFWFMITYMQVIMNLGLYEKDTFYKFHMLLCTAVLVVVALLCRERKPVLQNWKNKLTGSWYILWIIACFSDFLVKKRYMWAGYIMIFALGLLFFMWNNMEDRSRLVKEWMQAIKWSFVLNVVFCFLCRPEVEGTRYIGGYYNPGMFAMYLLFVWLVILQEVDEKLRQGKKIKCYLPEIIGSGILITLLWKTQSASGILPGALAFFIFGVKQIAGRRKGMVKLAAVTLLLGLIVSLFTNWGIHTIPQALHTEVNFENDTYVAQREMPLGPVTVYAGEENITDSRIFQKLFKSRSLESFTTRRSVYWVGYLRGMNLLGNENKEYLWGRNRWPHNGFVQMAYRYGVFTVIPYTVMVITSMYYSWRYLRQKRKYGFFIFSINICSFILILMENLELPFLFLCWFCMYLMMGILFEKPEEVQKTER